MSTTEDTLMSDDPSASPTGDTQEWSRLLELPIELRHKIYGFASQARWGPARKLQEWFEKVDREKQIADGWVASDHIGQHRNLPMKYLTDPPLIEDQDGAGGMEIGTVDPEPEEDEDEDEDSMDEHDSDGESEMDDDDNANDVQTLLAGHPDLQAAVNAYAASQTVPDANGADIQAVLNILHTQTAGQGMTHAGGYDVQTLTNAVNTYTTAQGMPHAHGEFENEAGPVPHGGSLPQGEMSVDNPDLVEGLDQIGSMSDVPSPVLPNHLQPHTTSYTLPTIVGQSDAMLHQVLLAGIQALHEEATALNSNGEEEGEEQDASFADDADQLNPPQVDGHVLPTRPLAHHKWQHVSHSIQLSHNPPPLSLLKVNHQLTSEILAYYYDLCTLVFNATRSFLHQSFIEEDVMGTLGDASFSPIEKLRKARIIITWDTKFLMSRPETVQLPVWEYYLLQRVRVAKNLLMKMPNLTIVEVKYLDSDDSGAGQFLLAQVNEVLYELEAERPDVQIDTKVTLLENATKVSSRSIIGKQRMQFKEMIDHPNFR